MALCSERNSFVGTISDALHRFYEKCRSRFHFFLLRRPVEVRRSDKDISSARRLEWSKHLISQCCTYKTDTTQDLILPSPCTLCWVRLARSWTVHGLKLSPQTTAWKILISVAGWGQIHFLWRPDKQMVGLTTFYKDQAPWAACWSRWKPPCWRAKMSCGGTTGKSRLAGKAALWLPQNTDRCSIETAGYHLQGTAEMIFI